MPIERLTTYELTRTLAAARADEAATPRAVPMWAVPMWAARSLPGTRTSGQPGQVERPVPAIVRPVAAFQADLYPVMPASEEWGIEAADRCRPDRPRVVPAPRGTGQR